MPVLLDKETGQPQDVGEEALVDALRSGRYSPRPGDRYHMVDSQGDLVTVDADKVERFLGLGAQPESAESLEARAREADLDDRYGGALGGGIAALGGLLRGATLGGSDALMTNKYGRAFVGSPTSPDELLADLLEERPELAKNPEFRSRIRHELGIDIEKLGDRDAQVSEVLRETRARHGGISTATEIAGAVLPSLIPGGAGAALARTPAGLAGAAGGAAARGIAGRTAGLASGGLLARAVARTAPVVAQTATEGAFFGAGMGLSQLVLEDEPLTAESVVAALGHGALHGAALGGVFGAGGVAAGAALRGAGRLAGRGAELLKKAEAVKAGKATAAAQKKAGQDMLTEQLDVLNTVARETRAQAEVLLQSGQVADDAAAAIRQALERATKAEAAVEGLAGGQVARKTWTEFQKERMGPLMKKHAGAGHKGAHTAAVREMAAEWKVYKAGSAGQATTGALARTPADLKGALGAIDEFEAATADLQARMPVGQAALPEAGQYLQDVAHAGERAVKVKAAGEAALGMDPGQATAPPPTATEKVKDLLFRVACGKSDQVAKIRGLDILAAAELAGLGPDLKALPGGQVAQTLLRVYAASRGLQLASRGSASDVISGLMGKGRGIPGLPGGLVSGFAARAAKATGGVLARTEKGLEAFVSGVGRPATRFAGPAAAQVLERVRFAPVPEDSTEKPARTRGEDKTGALYRARSAEVLRAAQQLPDFHAGLQAHFEGVGASPEMAGQIADATSRGVQFLASKVPPQLQLGQIGAAGRPYRPSDSEISRWARYVRAVDDPHALVEDLQRGTLTLETVEAVKTVYPEYFARVQRSLVERVSETRKELPYGKRLQLSILFGAPFDGSMRPEFIAAMQATFESEAAQQPQQQPGPGGGAGPAAPVQPSAAALNRIDTRNLETPAQRLANR